MNRRIFLANLLCTLGMVCCTDTPSKPMHNTSRKPIHILLRSSWQTVNIGDIAHTPGMLALLEKQFPNAEVTLWPNLLSATVENILKTRFPKLKIAKTKNEQQAALENCDFFLHGSGPGLVGWAEAKLAQEAKKPYGFAGITLLDEELNKYRDLLAGAKFIFTRETDSLTALCKAGISGPKIGFGPDATFALDIRDDVAADKLLKEYDLKEGSFLCAVPRLRWTPYWEIYPETEKPNPPKSAINEAFAYPDHAKLREAIIAWVTETGMRVFLVPEMTYQVPRLKPLLYDPLPNDIKPSVAVLDRYWLTAEAASVYAKAAAVVSFEMHSPIMAVAAATPAVHLRQPTDTRKGQMWRDIGLENWLFEIDNSTGEEIATRVVEIGKNLSLACQIAQNARDVARRRMAEMVAAIC
ncbi:MULTISPECIES: polysaccharide pyruvyl transferase family protein [unclassified Nostoc]|uniref:polysaccharide pyruvyl transferase family protein n=1 Tax=unclassified Nostoc TaxID=2593658 RepID=UPI0018F02D16|nr:MULTISPECIES: polysaccharide pyruvyl transferase family protein [unclassified Nostoc]